MELRAPAEIDFHSLGSEMKFSDLIIGFFIPPMHDPIKGEGPSVAVTPAAVFKKDLRFNSISLTPIDIFGVPNAS